jgi:hypothetical protein
MSGNNSGRRDDEQHGRTPHEEQPRDRRQGRRGQSQGGQPPENDRQRSQRQPNQAQGGQPRGGQQPQQRPQGPPGQGPPQQPQGGGGTDLDVGAIKHVAIWVTVVFAATGLVLGLLPTIYGSVGDSSTEVVEIDQDGTPVQDQSPNQEDSELTDEQQAAQSEQEQRRQNQFKQRLIVGLTGLESQGSGFFLIQTGVAPFLAIVLAVAVGLVVGVFSSLGDRDLVVATAASIVAGTVVLLFLSHFLAVQQWPTMPDPEYVEPMRQDLTVKTGALIINGVVVGLTAAIGGVAAAVSGDRLTEQ